VACLHVSVLHAFCKYYLQVGTYSTACEETLACQGSSCL
jgi:hypothetical protein